VENVDQSVDGMVLLNRYYKNIMRILNGYRLVHMWSCESGDGPSDSLKVV